MLLNLVSNAVKFTGRNGKINIRVKLIRFTSLQNTELEIKEPDKLEITVIDNGLGIKKKDFGKLFQMFGSIKDQKKKINTKGIGLGLVIS